MTAFELHPQLTKDCLEVTDWPLCKVLLMNDRRFPWLILVPRLAGLRDFDEAPDRKALDDEICRASALLRGHFSPHKMNVAALGNMVPQLHVHVIARFTKDAAWPGPVFGVGRAEPYRPQEAKTVLAQLRRSH